MATALPNANINIPYSPFLDENTGRPSQAWLQWLMNPSVISINSGNAIPVTSGGTGLTTIPTNGQLLIGNTTGNTLAKSTLTAGSNITITNGAGAITIAATSGSPGGSTTQVQYNSSGSFAGSANMTFSGTALTLANDATISGLTVGKGGGSVATNTVVGASALAATNTGGYCNAFGQNALAATTSGKGNIGIGVSALLINTS
jgi:hypothetical protein